MKEQLRSKTADVVFNPNAGNGNRRETIERASEWLKDEGWELELYQTQGPEHATEIARNAKNNGTSVVFAVGGDGTYNEVAQGLIGGNKTSQTALAPLPDGTIRMLRRGMNVPSKLMKAVQVLANDETSRQRTMDAGEMNGKYFLAAAGIGYDGHVINSARRSGVLGYVENTLGEAFNYEGSRAKVVIDGEEFDTRLHTAFFGNTRELAYFPLRREAKCDDGLLEATIFKSILPKGNGFFVGAAFASGLFFGNKNTVISEYAQGKDFLVQSEKPLYSHIDGEVLDKTNEWQIKVIPDALNVLVPRSKIDIFSRD